MHDLAVNQTVDCRIQFRLLPEGCRPAYVVRHLDVTLIAVDPRSTRGEVFQWAPDHLSVQERNTLRRAYGQPLVGEDMMPITLPADLPFPTAVPPALHLPAGPLRDLLHDSALI